MPSFTDSTTPLLSSAMDTICAVATAQGGALGVIRISGPQALSSVSKILDRPLSADQAGTNRFCRILSEKGEVLDEAVVSVWVAPHSYTGEDTVELSCHGSSYILQQTLQRLMAADCRLARPGEYTQRAFLNGKMDLSRAEAVADLIASTSAAAHRLAMNQMRGNFSNELKALRDRLLHLTSLLELELDFSDHEDVEFADRTELHQLAHEIERVIDRLVQSFSMGNAIRNGIPVAIVGAPNVGKSTLLNALIGDERAIVTDIPGTTRDIIDDTTIIDGVLFRFVDTAGLRATDDTIEQMGIARSYEQIDKAQIVLYVTEASPSDKSVNHENATLASDIASRCEGRTLIRVLNKADLVPAHSVVAPDFIPAHSIAAPNLIPISAKTGEGLDTLRRALLQAAALPSISASDVIVTNARHYEALTHALDSIHRVIDGLALGLSGDLIGEDLRQCIYHLSDIVGDVTTDDVLGNIFFHFCIGK